MVLKKKEDIEKVTEAIKILNIVDLEENSTYRQIKHAVDHLVQILPKKKEE